MSGSQRTGAGNADTRGAAVGLCATCVHALRVPSARGAQFWLCRLSAADARYPKYPRLPVLECSGHEDEEISRP